MSGIPMPSLLQKVRGTCETESWTQGVELARVFAVTAERADDEQITVRVKPPERAVAHTVTLHLEEGDWECDCGSDEEACAHVAAAIIAVNNAHKHGRPLPEAKAQTGGRVLYRLKSSPEGLFVARSVEMGPGKETPLPASLSALASGRAPGPRASATQQDFAVERELDGRAQGSLPANAIEPVLRALMGRTDVLLDGVPVAIDPTPLLPQAVLSDDGPSLRLSLTKGPENAQILAPGVALVDGTLRPLGAMTFTGPRREALPFTQVFPQSQWSALATKHLPDLEAQFPIEIRTSRLPRTVSGLKPRLTFELEPQTGGLEVHVAIVYGEPPMARVDGEKLVLLGAATPVRDEKAERELLRRLRDDLSLAPGRRVRFEGREAATLLGKLRTFQGGVGTTTRDDRGRALFRDVALAPRVQVSEDRLDVLFERPAAEGGPPERAHARIVLESWAAGLDVVPLLDGGYAPLPVDWLEKHGARLGDLIRARDAQGKLVPAAAPIALAWLHDMGEPAPPRLEALATILGDTGTLPQPALPPELTAELRGYQTAGVAWLAALGDAALGALLADDMGLGKTLQTLCAIRGRTLVVCPRSVIHNWAAEIERFRPGLEHHVYHGAERDLGTAPVTLTTYAVLRIDAERLAEEEWDTIVLDEAQNIKNPDSQAAQAACRLRGKRRIALSGTPVENRLEELWSLFRFTNPGLLGSLNEFRERLGRPVAAGEAGPTARLQALVRPFVLRRRKSEVAKELPPRTEMRLICELSASERDLYEAVRLAARRDVLQALDAGRGVMAALEALLRMRQAACHPSLVPGQSADTSSKIERLLEALDDARQDGHRSLVFSQFTSFLDLVEPHLRQAGIDWVRLDGSTRDRGAVVAQFQDPTGPPVMLLSLKAGGTGLNLTAADHVFLLDPWWNPAVEDQAADRAHRIGQDRPVMVYRVVAKDTVEERILALGEHKRGLAEVALGGASGASGITKEELLALLD